RLIPRGILREPLTALRRATAIILTRCDQVRDPVPVVEMLRTICPRVPVRTTRHAPRHLSRLKDRHVVALEFLRDRPVKAVCAIAHPEAFFKTLEQLGARITERIALPDHAEIPAAAMEGEGITVITEKDAVGLGSARSNMLSLHIELEDYP
ncbi:MAG: tetraacyldisaccharide 4'-kinase, partial [Armatimonadetes bacterium]|nr:tetraacyldisaccharide 4'-kinase [Armatimonadota bacterium]